MPTRIQVLSVQNPLLHILCKCSSFCLLLLETQVVQSVQLEKLAFLGFFLSFLEHLAPNKLVFTHSSKCTNGYSGLIYTDSCRRHRRERPSSSSSDRIAWEMMRASDLLAVTNMYTHKP